MQTALPKPLLPWDIMTCSGSRWTKSQGTSGNASKTSTIRAETADWNLMKSFVWGDRAPSAVVGDPRRAT